MAFVNPNRLPRVLAITPGAIPSAMIYLVKPLVALASRNQLILAAIAEHETTYPLIDWCDVLVLCRNCEPVHRFILDYARFRSKPIIYDLDDNFWEIPLDMEDGRYLRVPERIEMLEAYLRQASLVRVYNSLIHEKVAEINPRIVQLRPCIDLGMFPGIIHRPKRERIRIAYSTTRGASDPLLGVILEDLVRILKTYPHHVEVFMWGSLPPAMEGLTNVKVLPIIPEYEKFLINFDQEGYDIGLAPLLSTPFYLSKTDTKFRDYGAVHVSGIYSNVSVYSTVIHEQTGLLVGQEPGAWFNAIERLVFDEALRKHIEVNAFRTIYNLYRQELMEDAWRDNLQQVLSWIEWPEDVKQDAPGEIHSNLQEIYLESKPNQPHFNPEQVEQNPGSSGGELRIYTGCDPFVQTVVDPADLIHIENDSIDLLVANLVLQDVRDPETVIREIYRVCHHGAQVCVVAPSGYQMASVQDSGRPLGYIESFQDQISALVRDAHNGKPLQAFLCMNREIITAEDRQSLSKEQQELVWQSSHEIRDQNLYSLMVVKTSVTMEEVKQMAAQWKYYEPPQVTARRYKDLYEKTTARMEELRNIEDQSIQLVNELEVVRNRRILRIVNRLTSIIRSQPDNRLVYPDLLDDSLLYLNGIQGYRLKPGTNLQGVSEIKYKIVLNKPNLTSLSLVLLVDLKPNSGDFGLEISTLQDSFGPYYIAFNQVDVSQPVKFVFEPISATSYGPLEFRLFTRDVKIPIRILEWQKYHGFGFGHLDRKPFFGFGF